MMGGWEDGRMGVGGCGTGGEARSVWTDSTAEASTV